MKRSLLFALSVFVSSQALHSQINLIGVSNNNGGAIDIVTWEALDSNTVQSYPTILDAYLLASSAYDAYNATYYLTGISGDSAGLLSYTIPTQAQELRPYTNFTNISEFDMSTGKIYNLRMDSTGFISVNEYIIRTGADSLIGVIQEPGVEGLLVDAIGFNSNAGILYYIGYTSDPAIALYSIPVRENTFSYSKTLLASTAFASNFSSLNYDNFNDRLFAMTSNFDSLGNYLGNLIVEIDTVTGAVATLTELTGFEAFQVSTSSFDQSTGSFMLVGIDTNFVRQMIVVDTYDNTFTTGFVPSYVSEIVCDNNAFALAYYGTTSVAESTEKRYTLYPNPATSYINVSGNHFPGEEAGILVFGMDGRQVLEEQRTQGGSLQIDISPLGSGLYLLRIFSGSSAETYKFIVR